MIDTLHRGLTHLLAFSATGGCLCFGLLTVMFPKTDVHIPFDIGGMIDDVTDDPLFDRPPEEIELADGGFFDGRMVADLETDALATTERVE